jgi:Rhodopirellula transposase DDE domain
LEGMEQAEAPLSPSQIEDLRLAASIMKGGARRSFQAEMTVKYCDGKARLAERVFGWGRVNVEVGLAERRSGIQCVGAQAGYSGSQRWEEQQPEVAAALRQLAEAHAQQDPTFASTIAYTRLTAQQALTELRQQGFAVEQLPAQSTMSVILNRMGYRLQPVVKAKPQKNSPKPTRFLTTSKSKTMVLTRVKSND